MSELDILIGCDRPESETFNCKLLWQGRTIVL